MFDNKPLQIVIQTCVQPPQFDNEDGGECIINAEDLVEAIETAVEEEEIDESQIINNANSDD